MLDIKHCDKVIDLLEDLGLAARAEKVPHLVDPDSRRHIYYFDKSLEPKRYVPPTTADDGVLSPVFARIIIYNPNSDNVQYLDSFGISKYLAKCVADVDEDARVFVSAPPPGSANMFEHRCREVETRNTKIASVALEQKKGDSRSKTKPIGRVMTQPECLMLHFGVAPVNTNIKFVHISTVPLEQRPALDRTKPLHL